jgi:hypothetical protein
MIDIRMGLRSRGFLSSQQPRRSAKYRIYYQNGLKAKGLFGCHVETVN